MLSRLNDNFHFAIVIALNMYTTFKSNVQIIEVFM